MKNTVIITGGPGSGKTTLMNHLSSLGFHTCPEVSRMLIEDSLKKGSDLLPWIDLKAFAHACYLEMDKQKYSSEEFPNFVDRAMGDIIAYMHMGNLNGECYREAAARGYFKTVFLLKPEKDIYVQDEVRPHSFEEALLIHEEIRRVYESLGFSLMELPLKEPEKLADDVLKVLNITSRRISV